MRCLRCGKCCFDSAVVIIKPEFVKEDLVVDELPQEAFIGIVPGMEIEGVLSQCPHLVCDKDGTSCKIHHYKWFEDTPCFQYGQIEKDPDQPCRFGEYIRNKNDGGYKAWRKKIGK
jgi:hypothetical protein